jgi:mannose/fructose/N-acetylgalactosamine-specific phosphotransferase system component IIC
MDLLQLSLLGGALALDATAVGQFMVSRPLIAGALTGWLLGDVAQGLMLGSILEIYLLVSFPTGGSRFPEGPTATVVAVATAAAGTGAGGFAVALSVGLLWGQISGITVTGTRKLNGRFVPEPNREGHGAGGIVRAHLGLLLLDFLRGGLVTLAGVVVGRWVVGRLAAGWPLATEDTVGLVLVGAAVSAGVLLRDLGGFRRRRLLLAVGLAIGLIGFRFF